METVAALAREGDRRLPARLLDRPNKYSTFFLLVTALACASGCNDQQMPMPGTPKSQAAIPPATPVTSKEVGYPAYRDKQSQKTRIERIASKHLPNPVRVHAKVISGGLPEGDEAFAELKELGIKTVISVDGAKPNLALAEKYGMRYIHLPHGYDGVPANRAWELAKAVRDLPGPIYVHCHHGKHRSPAATAVACVGAGMIPHEDAALVLKIAETSEAYRGLFQSADEARPLDDKFLDELQVDFPAAARLPKMAETMVAIEHILDHLNAIEKAGWKTPTDRPALVPRHEALLLREQFTELLRTKELLARSEKFQQLAKEAETLCVALEDSLATTTNGEVPSQRLQGVSDNCKSCHQAFRDIPFFEKEEVTPRPRMRVR